MRMFATHGDRERDRARHIGNYRTRGHAAERERVSEGKMKATRETSRGTTERERESERCMQNNES